MPTDTRLTIVGTGTALAALNIGLFAWLRTDMRELRQRMSALEKPRRTSQGSSRGCWASPRD